MIAVLRSEWLKLRTTTIPWLLSGIALFITGLLLLVYFLNHGDGGPEARAGGFGPPTPPNSCGTWWVAGSTSTYLPSCSGC